MKEELKRTLLKMPLSEWMFLKVEAARRQSTMSKIMQEALECYKKQKKGK
jgi:hypothetical protein